MIKVVYAKKVACPFPIRHIEAIVSTAARHEKKIKGTVEVTVVGDKDIKDLNRRYRGLDTVTDVLSFAWKEDLIVPSTLLGQIYLSYPQIKRQSKDFGCTPREEFIRMLTHGLLHIVGYDHSKENEAKKMFPLQEKIVADVKKKTTV